MNFYSVRELRSNSKTIWDTLTSGDEVVITNNGKPSALMLDIPDGAFDDVIQAVRQAKSILAMNRMRHRAEVTGFLSDSEIDRIVSDVRQETSV